MSDSGQGGGERSWWEKPDRDAAAQDPYRAGPGEPGGDAHDPYRVAPGDAGGAGSDAPTQAHPVQPPAAPTQGVPQPGPPPSSWSDPQYGNQPYADQPYGNQPYGNQQYANPPYPGQPNQQYPQHGGYGYEQQPPVAGTAHAVLWTAVGGLVLSFTGLGWIASIVALALVPGARREILEAQGAKRGLGFLLAGKICAWVNIALTVLAVLGLVVLFGIIGANGGFDDTSSFDGNGLNTLFAP